MEKSLPSIAAVEDVLEDLEWRGLLAQTTDRGELEAALAEGVTLYCGFDPTADSLHLGNLVPLFALRRFQLGGHRAIALVGGATGMVGDPSGRSAERVLSGPEEVRARSERLRVQMRHLLGEEAVLVDNLEWTQEMSALDFLRDVGKHFPVNQMLARESVSARLEGGGLSFTEFAYQLLQSLDFVELYRRFGCTLQVGATDQWGNITAGLDLLRRVERAGGHALTFPLITDSSGQKIGKSTGGGAVWVDPLLTSPYALWQFCLNVEDSDVVTYLKLLTFVGQEEIRELEEAVRSRPAARLAQRRLADEVVALVHGAEEVERVRRASAALFGGGDLSVLNEDLLLAALQEAPSISTQSGASVVEVLSKGMGISRSEARRAVKDGGVYLNNERVRDEGMVLEEEAWLHGRTLLLRKGKRSVLVVQRESEE